ncbi:domain of Kin17 curved DNA-binding protein-domain-containing protein, partial [Chytriomyces sp. MP71]
MGKGRGFVTPKAIASRIKAKGMQKLRCYCQMCEKQPRTARAKSTSDNQMSLFSENSGPHSRAVSTAFPHCMDFHLMPVIPTQRVHANVVYQKYIADRNHVHMNSTAWNSVNGFARTLASEGTIILEETEKGRFITWVDKSPETLARQEANGKTSKDERNAKLLEEQIEKS